MFRLWCGYAGAGRDCQPAAAAVARTSRGRGRSRWRQPELQQQPSRDVRTPQRCCHQWPACLRACLCAAQNGNGCCPRTPSSPLAHCLSTYLPILPILRCLSAPQHLVGRGCHARCAPIHRSLGILGSPRYRCRSCGKPTCDGHCFGFWRLTPTKSAEEARRHREKSGRGSGTHAVGHHGRSQVFVGAAHEESAE
jgi:hypothetical protein